MQSVIVSTYPKLASVGEFITRSEILPLGSYSVGPDTYTLVDGLSYDVVLSNTGEALLLTGTVRATAIGECSRCLEPVTLDIVGEVEGYYLLNHENGAPQGMDEDEFSFVPAGGDIDISDALLAALVIETPIMLLCAEDCLGLCHACGKKLNEGPCGCKEEKIDPTNPFAALKDFVVKDEPPAEQ